jgi:hypothetical protein
MTRRVFAYEPDTQIIRIVACSTFRPMMDLLVAAERTAKNLSHHDAVLKLFFVIMLDFPISAFGEPAPAFRCAFPLKDAASDVPCAYAGPGTTFSIKAVPCVDSSIRSSDTHDAKLLKLQTEQIWSAKSSMAYWTSASSFRGHDAALYHLFAEASFHCHMVLYFCLTCKKN